MAQSRITRSLRLTGTVVQGGADAFAIAEVQTGLQGLGTRALLLSFLQIEVNGIIPNVNIARLELAVSRATKAAMPNITDRDLIAKFHKGVTFTTSGATFQPIVETLTPAADVVVVEDPLYFLIDGTLTGNTYTAYLAMEFQEISISEVDRLAIIASRLGG